MKSNFLRYLALALILPALIIPLGACAKPLPAAFEVTSLAVTPQEVTAGGTASVSAEVKNTGGSEGTYSAALTVDGATVETKQVTVAAGASKTVSFSLMKDKAGTYQIGVGGLTSKLTVKPKLVLKEVELKYDDGEARAFGSAFAFKQNTELGYLVDFTSPANPLTIKKIRVAAAIYSLSPGWEKMTFDLQILDKTLKVLYTSTYPITKFPLNAVVNTWTEFEVPNIQVTEKFYVDVLVSYPAGLSTTPLVGADDSVPNQHSNFAFRATDGAIHITQWVYSGSEWWADKNQVNWMIRVVGTGMMPES